MPLKINTTATLMTAYRGEPATWEYQPCDLNGVPEDLTGTRWEWGIADSGGGEQERQVGEVLSDETGHFVRFRNTGELTARLFDVSPVRWTLVRNLDDGNEPVLVGEFNILPGALEWYDNNGAPSVRFITRIKHFYDPTSDRIVSPEVKMRKVSPSTPVPGYEPSTDFSNSANSQYLGLF